MAKLTEEELLFRKVEEKVKKAIFEYVFQPFQAVLNPKSPVSLFPQKQSRGNDEERDIKHNIKRRKGSPGDDFGH